MAEPSRFSPMPTTDPREKPVPAAWRAEIAAWTIALRAAGRSRETIRTRTDHLRRASRALGGVPWRIGAEDLMTWVGTQGWSRETRRSVYASLRSFWRWGVDTGRCATSPADRLPRVNPQPPHPMPTPDKIYRRALEAADSREWLILQLGAVLGLRRGEIAQVHSQDLIEDLVGTSLIVHGKGGKTRVVPLEGALVKAVREACLAGGGYAFPGKIDGHLSAQRVGNLASRLMPGGWTLHKLRHRCAATIDELAGIRAAQELLGHASLATTERYVPVRHEVLRRAIRVSAA